jgi:hypothetical protein
MIKTGKIIAILLGATLFINSNIAFGTQKTETQPSKR